MRIRPRRGRDKECASLTGTFARKGPANRKSSLLQFTRIDCMVSDRPSRPQWEMSKMSVLTFTTSGKMTIILYGAQFGNVLTDPDNDPNVKTFDRTQPSKLYLEVQDERKFAPWGKIQVIVQGPNPT